MALVVCNGLAAFLCWVFLRWFLKYSSYLCRFPPSPPFLSNLLLYIAVGFSLALNGLLLVYASLPDRTPGAIIVSPTHNNYRIITSNVAKYGIHMEYSCQQ